MAERGRPSGDPMDFPVAPTIKLTPGNLKTIRPIVAALAAKGASALDVAELLGNKYPVPVVQALFSEEFISGAARVKVAVVQKFYDVILQTGDPALIKLYLTRRGGPEWSEGPAAEKANTPKRLAIA